MSTGIEFFKGEDGQHYFRVKAANGKTVAASEAYTGERNARRGAEALLKALTDDIADQAEPRPTASQTTAETIAQFAMTYAGQLRPLGGTSSYLVIAQDRRDLFNLLEKATAAGWTLTPPPNQPTEDPPQ